LKGEQLSVAGWQSLAELFVAPGVRGFDKVMVVKNFAVSDPLPAKGGQRVGFSVGYTPLGLIYLSDAHFSPLPKALAVRADFSVVKQFGPRTRASSVQTEHGVWRIEGPVPQPHVTVDTAIRYANELRTNAKDAGTRKNADVLLTALRRLH
jgi:hypothetical protein